MDYQDAAEKLLQLLEEADFDANTGAEALEQAGPVHAEALIASFTAFNIALSQVKATAEAGGGPAKTTRAGVELQPMPSAHAEIQLGFPLSTDQLALLQAEAQPEDAFDRWFLAYDNRHVRFYRNATGFCFFDCSIEEDADGIRVGTVVVNQDEKQYSETTLGVCAAQVKILLANTLGLDDEPYWDEMDAAADAQDRADAAAQAKAAMENADQSDEEGE